jgi:hypothetical protein
MSTLERVWIPQLLTWNSTVSDVAVVVHEWLQQQSDLPPHHLHWWGREETLKIADVRELQSLLSLTVNPTHVQIHVLAEFDSVATSTQNALLKTLEEPPTQTWFLLLSRHPQLILPTIISRCRQINLDLKPEKQENTTYPSLADFSSAPTSQLLAWAETYQERPAAIGLVEHLLRTGHHQLRTAPHPTTAKQLQILLSALETLHTNAAPRLVLEHCCFALAERL